MTKIKVLAAVHGEFSSHTVRILEIAKKLRETERFEIFFSGRGPYMNLIKKAGFSYVETPAVSCQEVKDALENQLVPVFFHQENIEDLFQAEDRVLREYKPDIIFRDAFRDLLGIAAKKHGTFDVFLQKANSCPYYGCDFIPANTPWYLGFNFGEEIRVMPIFRFIERIARKKAGKYLRHKAKEVGLELEDRVYDGFEADLILMPDSELLFPFSRMSDKYKFIGPLLVLNQAEKPVWIEEFVSDRRKKIIATGGSTGWCDRIGLFAEAFKDKEYALAINHSSGEVPEGFYSGKFEISSIIQYADVFITHGGTGSTYLGLRNGIPMIVLYNHIEQQINANQLRKLGVGVGLNPRKISPQQLRESIEYVSTNPEFKQRAEEASRKIGTNSSVELAVKYIREGYEEFKSQQD